MASKFTLVTSTDTIPLPDTFVPSNLFQLERDYTIERDVETEVTQLRGDGFVKPYSIKISGRIDGASMQDLSTKLRGYLARMANVTELQYNSELRIALLQAWAEVKTESSYPSSANVTFVLVPIYPDIPEWDIDKYYWGETTLLMGNTSVIMGDN